MYHTPVVTRGKVVVVAGEHGKFALWSTWRKQSLWWPNMDSGRGLFCPFCGKHMSSLTRFCFASGWCLEFIKDAEQTETPDMLHQCVQYFYEIHSYAVIVNMKSSLHGINLCTTWDRFWYLISQHVPCLNCFHVLAFTCFYALSRWYFLRIALICFITVSQTVIFIVVDLWKPVNEVTHKLDIVDIFQCVCYIPVHYQCVVHSMSLPVCGTFPFHRESNCKYVLGFVKVFCVLLICFLKCKLVSSLVKLFFLCNCVWWQVKMFFKM